MNVGGRSQYYPTPPEACGPIVDYLSVALTPGQEILDPAAGRGALPLFMRDLGARWHLIELLDEFKPDLMRVPGAASVRIADSLREEWPRSACVVANPPYGRELEGFVDRIWTHARKFRVFGAVLTRITWWGEGDRGVRWRPDCLLWIRGRLSFTADGKADSSSHCWAIWDSLPCPETRVQWCDQSQATARERALQRKMLGLEGAQIGLFEAPS